jgi:lipase
LGPDFQLLDFECNHMVPYVMHVQVATLVREQLEGR